MHASRESRAWLYTAANRMPCQQLLGDGVHKKGLVGYTWIG